ncbi:GNAT family N-acetyltransferase [Formosa algae]|uniref:GNAT family N-acetyltransferase n=1 Tax=Formosa algae TaxID=225843 RepID=UPI000CCF34CA|nr:GNAT family N-acetyltransferase [Formosa algae]PNW26013.1 hypothetical protein BKP44_18490 [Formosa algae]
MIKQLDCKQLEESIKIHILFQLSYTVEAERIGCKDFPPLKRTIDDYNNSSSLFYGFFENNALAGIIEIQVSEELTDIHSLVVNPKYFRHGIAKQLVNHVLKTQSSACTTVETALLNTPATHLYKSLGFMEEKQFNSAEGIKKIQFKRCNKA